MSWSEDFEKATPWGGGFLVGTPGAASLDSILFCFITCFLLCSFAFLFFCFVLCFCLLSCCWSCFVSSRCCVVLVQRGFVFALCFVLLFLFCFLCCCFCFCSKKETQALASWSCCWSCCWSCFVSLRSVVALRFWRLPVLRVVVASWSCCWSCFVSFCSVVASCFVASHDRGPSFSLCCFAFWSWSCCWSCFVSFCSVLLLWLLLLRVVLRFGCFLVQLKSPPGSGPGGLFFGCGWRWLLVWVAAFVGAVLQRVNNRADQVPGFLFFFLGPGVPGRFCGLDHHLVKLGACVFTKVADLVHLMLPPLPGR